MLLYVLRDFTVGSNLLLRTDHAPYTEYAIRMVADGLPCGL